MGGILVIYAVGVPWSSVATGLPLGEVVIGSLLFLPGDILKAIVATIVAVAVHRNYRALLEG